MPETPPNIHDLQHQVGHKVVQKLLDIAQCGSTAEQLQACSLLVSILYPHTNKES